MKLWNHSLVVGLLVAGMFGASAGAQAPKKAVELGSINFPTSAKPAAQAPFLTGVKALYNFEVRHRRPKPSARRRRPTRRSRSPTGARR